MHVLARLAIFPLWASYTCISLHHYNYPLSMHLRPPPCGYSFRLKKLIHSSPACRRCFSSRSDTALPSHALNSYTPSTPPSIHDLDRATRFFARGPVSFLFSAGKLPQIPHDSQTPEIALLGRSNVGKSSLLNALLNKKNAKLAHESKHPGRTRTLNFFGVGGAAEVSAGSKRVAKRGMSMEMLKRGAEGKKDVKRGSEVRNVIGKDGLAVVDCPGYGFGSRDEWGEVVVRYLQKREQLVRAYLLVDIEVGIKRSDELTLEILREAGTPHQIVLSKVDKILFPGARLDMERLPERLMRLREVHDDFRMKVLDKHAATSLCTDIICTSSNDGSLGKYKRIGIEELQYAVLDAAGLIGAGKEIDKYEQEQERSEYHGLVGWDQLENMGTASKTTRAPAR